MHAFSGCFLCTEVCGAPLCDQVSPWHSTVWGSWPPGGASILASCRDGSPAFHRRRNRLGERAQAQGAPVGRNSLQPLGTRTQHRSVKLNFDSLLFCHPTLEVTPDWFAASLRRQHQHHEGLAPHGFLRFARIPVVRTHRGRSQVSGHRAELLLFITAQDGSDYPAPSHLQWLQDCPKTKARS